MLSELHEKRVLVITEIFEKTTSRSRLCFALLGLKVGMVLTYNNCNLIFFLG